MVSLSSSLACIKRYALAILLNSTASFAHLNQHLRGIAFVLHRFFAHKVSLFWIHLIYFVGLSLAGSIALLLLSPNNPDFSPRYVDMLYLSTSSLTVSGLATVRMEDLSSSQVVAYTLLMLLGGEVFVSLLGVLLSRPKSNTREMIDPVIIGIELGNSLDHRIQSGSSTTGQITSMADHDHDKELKHKSIRCLGYVIMGYHLLFHVAGTVFILLYVTIIPSAGDVLRRKRINAFLFSLSLAVSSFANGGLVPTNENMIVFRENSGLLLVVVALVLAGNTLFPLMLRAVVWALMSCRMMKEEMEHMVKRPRDVRYWHLLTRLQTATVSVTVVGFLVLQVAFFCSNDWGGAVFEGLNSYQKVVNALFMAANTRHAGEGSVDLATVSAAVNVLFMVMMFLPSSTSFTPITGEEEDDGKITTAGNGNKSLQDMILPPVSMIVVFLIALCMTERKKMSKDSVNFSVFNILFEVISAYGNVGLSIGYGCARQVHPDGSCMDQPYSFSGWWSDRGKVILSMVMLYGRLKKYTMRNGRAWRL